MTAIVIIESKDSEKKIAMSKYILRQMSVMRTGKKKEVKCKNKKKREKQRLCQGIAVKMGHLKSFYHSANVNDISSILPSYTARWEDGTVWRRTSIYIDKNLSLPLSFDFHSVYI